MAKKPTDLGFVRICYEQIEQANGKEVEETSYLWRVDPAMQLILFALSGLTAFVGWLTANIWMAIGLFLLTYLLVGLVILTSFAVRVSVDVMCVRTFIGPAGYFTDCWVLSIPRITTEVFIPGSVRVYLTDDELDKQFALTVQQQQGKDEEDKLGLVLVIIRVMGNLDIWNHPKKLARSFYREFARRNAETIDEAMERAMTAMVRQDILAIVVSVGDEILQQIHTLTMLKNAKEANKQLEESGIRDDLWKAGVNLMDIAVEDTQDAYPGGFVDSMNRGTAAEQQGKARQRTAVANRDAGVAEQNSQRDVYIAQEETERAEIKVRERQAEQEVKPLQRFLEEMDKHEDPMAKALMSSWSRLSAQEQIEFVRGAGSIFWPQGGDFTGVDLESPLFEALKRFTTPSNN